MTTTSEKKLGSDKVPNDVKIQGTFNIVLDQLLAIPLNWACKPKITCKIGRANTVNKKEKILKPPETIRITSPKLS